MNEVKKCPKCGVEIPGATPEGRCPKCMLRAGLAEESSAPTFEGDKNLLFGVFAVQLRKVTPQEIMAAAGAWAADTTKDIPTRLLQQGVLTPADVEFIARLVDEAVRAHGGDLQATLHTLGGDQVLQATYRNSVDLSRYRFGATGTAVYLDNKPLDPDAVPGVQETPGRYTHVSEHARGGMGRVLLVHDGFLGRNVALKELMPGTRPASDPENPSTPVRQYMGFLSRFLQEARITGQLEHPSIVPVYELGHRQDGTLYYTMKLVRGKTLREAIAQCKTMQDRLALLAHFVDLCQAVAYAHSRGIVHRDIKPDNVMVGEFGETVVLDWGLAKSKDREDCHADGLAETIRMLQLGDVDSALKTQYGQVMGTPGYMSPEQALGRITEVDEKSDVYSLGAVLYQMLAGRPPFTGKSVPEILQKVVDDDPEPLDATTVPPELAAICMKAMSKRTEDRYPSASAMADEVRRFQTGAIVQAYSYGFGHHLKRFATKHKAVLTTAAAALIAIVALAGYSYTNIRQARDVAETERDKAEKNLASEQIKSARISVQVADSALEQESDYDTARATLWDVPPEFRTWEWGRVLNRAYPEAFTWKLDDNPLATRQVALSPHRDALIIWSTTDPGSVWNWQMGSRVRLENPGAIELAAFSSDGAKVITVSPERVVQLWDGQTGKRVLELDGHLVDGVFAPLSEQEARSEASVVFQKSYTNLATQMKDGRLSFWNIIDGSAMATTLTDAGKIKECAFSPDGKLFAAIGTDANLKVWDTRTGESRWIQAMSTAAVDRLSYSSDGSRLVTESVSMSSMELWDTQSGAKIGIIDGHRDADYPNTLFSPDGTQLVTRHETSQVHLFDLTTGKGTLALHDAQGKISVCEFSPDGRRVLIATNLEPFARLLDSSNGKELVRLNGLSGPLSIAEFNSDGTQIVLVSGRSAGIWNCDTGELHVLIATEQKHGTPIEKVSFNEDGSRIFTYSNDCIVGRNSQTLRDWHIMHGWDAQTGAHVARIGRDGESQFDDGLYFSPDGDRAVTDWRTSAFLWNTRTGEQVTQIHQPVSKVVFSQDSTRFVTASQDGGPPQLWDSKTGKLIATVAADAAYAWGIAISADGNRIVSGGTDKCIHVFDVTKNTEIAFLRGHTRTIINVALSPDGSRALSISFDGTARLWDIARQAELARRQLIEQPPSWENYGVGRVRFPADMKALAESRSISGLFGDECGFSADGRLAFWGAKNKAVSVLDAQSGLIVQDTMVFAPARISPDSSRILGTALVGSSTLQSLTDGSELVPADISDESEVLPDTSWTRVVRVSSMHTAQVWKTENAMSVVELPGHIICGFTSDGNQAVSLSRTGIPHIWSTSDWSGLATLNDFERLPGRDMSRVEFADTGNEFIVIRPAYWEANKEVEPEEVGVWSAITGSPFDAEFPFEGGLQWLADQRFENIYRSTRADDDGLGRVRIWHSEEAMGSGSGVVPGIVRIVDAQPGLYLELFKPERSGGMGLDEELRLDWYNQCIREAALHVLTKRTGSSFAVFNVATKQDVSKLELPAHYCSAFSADGELLATGSSEGIAQVWSVETGSLVSSATQQSAMVTSIGFSSDAKFVVCGYSNGHAVVWDAQTSVTIRELVINPAGGGVYDVGFSPDGRFVAALSHNYTGDRPSMMSLWDVQSDPTVAVISLDKVGYWHPYGFSLDSKKIGVGFQNGSVHVYATESGHQELELRGHSSEVGSVTYSPEGDRILTTAYSAYDDSVCVWDARSGAQILKISSPDGLSSIGEFSRDGNLILTYPDYEVVNVWDARSGELLSRLDAPCWGDYEGTALFGADGRSVIAIYTPGREYDVLSEGQRVIGINPPEVGAPDVNSIRIWNAAPWRLEDLPGEGDAWLERFRLWKFQEYARSVSGDLKSN